MSIFKPTFDNVMDATLRHIDLIRGAETMDELNKITAYSDHIIAAARKVDTETGVVIASMIYRESIHHSVGVFQSELGERFETQIV